MNTKNAKKACIGPSEVTDTSGVSFPFLKARRRTLQTPRSRMECLRSHWTPRKVRRIGGEFKFKARNRAKSPDKQRKPARTRGACVSLLRPWRIHPKRRATLVH